MEVFWAIFLSVVFVFVVVAWIQSTRQKKKAKKYTDRFLSEVDDYVRSGKIYTVVLSDGRKFEDAKILGYSKFSDSVMAATYIPTAHWLVLELPDTKKVYLRPGAIRYFEEKPEPNQPPQPTTDSSAVSRG